MKKVSRVMVGVLIAFVVGFALDGFGARAAPASSSDKGRARADRALREGEFNVAEKLYRELLEKDGKDVPARLGLSYTLLKQRNLRDAYDAAARVLAVDPTSARAHALLGSALLAAGDFDLSFEEFRTALSFKDDEALAIAGLALIDYYNNHHAASLSGLRRAMFIDPDEPDFVFDFAQAAARSERYRDAADAYERFLRIAPRTDVDRRARIRGLIDFLRFLGTQRPLYQTSGPARAQVPFEVVNNRPLLSVRLNGVKEPLRFVIDTGSGMCVISGEAAERLGVHPVAHGGMARAVGGGGRFDIVYGFLSALQIGEARIENVPVYIRPFHNKHETIDGYLGLSVLSKYLAAVDYGGRTLTLAHDEQHINADSIKAAETRVATDQASTKNAATASPPGFELPIRSTSSGFWSGSVVLDGVEKPQNFIIDTGASISVVSSDLATREEVARFAQSSRLRVYGAAGVAEDVPLLLLPHVKLGTYTHPNLRAAVLDMNPINETSGFVQAGIIGGNILSSFRVTFDFQHGVVRLDPIATKPETTPARDADVTPAQALSLL